MPGPSLRMGPSSAEASNEYCWAYRKWYRSARRAGRTNVDEDVQGVRSCSEIDVILRQMKNGRTPEEVLSDIRAGVSLKNLPGVNRARSASSSRTASIEVLSGTRAERIASKVYGAIWRRCVGLRDQARECDAATVPGVVDLKLEQQIHLLGARSVSARRCRTLRYYCRRFRPARVRRFQRHCGVAGVGRASTHVRLVRPLSQRVPQQSGTTWIGAD